MSGRGRGAEGPAGEGERVGSGVVRRLVSVPWWYWERTSAATSAGRFAKTSSTDELRELVDSASAEGDGGRNSVSR